MSGEQKHVTGGRGLRGAISFLPWLICLVSVALTLLTPVLTTLNGRTFFELISEGEIFIILILGTTFPAVGALIASRHPRNPVGWIFCLAGFFQALSFSGFEYATYALITAPGSLPGGAEMSWVSNWIWAPGLALILIFLPLLFPNGRPPSPRWRWVAWSSTVLLALVAVVAVLLLWPARGPALLGDTDNTGDSGPILGALLNLLFPAMMLNALAAVVSMFARFRRARGDERQQLKWFAYASALTFAGVAITQTFVSTGPIYGILIVLTLPSLPVAAAIAILKYRLYDIDLIINRTLVYGLLTGTLALIYWGSVVGLQALFRPLFGQGNDLAIVVSTLAIAALFLPLRRRIQSFIDRRFYRRKYDAAKTLSQFSQTVRDEVDLQQLTARLVEVTEETMQPAHVSLWLREPDARRGTSR